MKINKIIVESKKLSEATAAEIDPEKVEDELTAGEGAEDVLDASSASTNDIAAQVAAGAADASVGVVKSGAINIAKDVQTFVRDPYNDKNSKYYCAGNPGKVKDALQICLNAALDDKEAGLGTSESPNLILEGLAGFGKTAQVKEFCKEHGIYLFNIDAKSLDTATVGGIPYPTKDPKTGEITQSPIASKFWKPLDEHKNVILFLDELNRAPGQVRGTLLTLVNNHELPVFVENSDGSVETTKYFPNILFSIIAINPASDIFPDVEKLDPAEVSRNIGIIDVNGDKKEYLTHITRLYKTILANPRLNPKLRDRYEGQLNLATALLTNQIFTFDDADEVRRKYNDDAHGTQNFLNYRTFMIWLRGCDGTKKSLLKIVSTISKAGDKVVNMYKTILGTYVDKPTTGNKVFNQNTPTAVQIKTAQQIKDALDTFERML